MEDAARQAAGGIIEWMFKEAWEREDIDPDFITHTITDMMEKQRKADIEKLRGVLNTLMIDTKDKCKILELMEK